MRCSISFITFVGVNPRTTLPQFAGVAQNMQVKGHPLLVIMLAARTKPFPGTSIVKLYLSQGSRWRAGKGRLFRSLMCTRGEFWIIFPLWRKESPQTLRRSPLPSKAWVSSTIVSSPSPDTIASISLMLERVSYAVVVQCGPPKTTNVGEYASLATLASLKLKNRFSVVVVIPTTSGLCSSIFR